MTARRFVLALDQGTTGSTALVVDQDGEVRARGYAELAQHYPQPGWVEHDPAQIWSTTVQALGQAVTAFVVPRRAADGTTMLSADDLDRFCREAKDFASFKRPRRYELVDALPKSPTGKLLRRRLLEG